MGDILIVDDERDIRELISDILQDEGFETRIAGTAEECMKEVDAAPPGLLILDLWLKDRDLDGIDILKKVKKNYPHVPVVIISGHGNIEIAVAAIKQGAYDFIEKPFNINQLLVVIRRAMEASQLRRENLELRSKEEPPSDMIGQSSGFKTLLSNLDKVTKSNARVLLTGASGSGKEVAARHIHSKSGRGAAPFVPIQCGAIPADMVEHELFGYAPGAFPGAQTGREGLLAQAAGGTVFLDDVCELSLNAQTALLRVLEDGVIRPVGTGRDVRLDLRFLIASSKNLQEAVRQGRFRDDLLFRVNVVEVSMPPLRDRGEDILKLVDLFQTEIATALNLPKVELSPTVRAALLRYDWPGNIRELHNFVERALIFGKFQVDTLGDRAEVGSISLLEDLEKREILRALEALDGNRSEAARRLGISRKTIDRKCASWGF